MGAVRGLECSGCRETFEGSRLSAVCPECQSPLLAQYDLEALRTRLTADVVGRRPSGLWGWGGLPPAPPPLWREIEAPGGQIHKVNGLIDQAGREASAAAREQGWLDLSTFREVGRVEGKKTMGLELAESLGGELPDVILYPTGGGPGLVGIAKAFRELKVPGGV